MSYVLMMFGVCSHATESILGALETTGFSHVQRSRRLETRRQFFRQLVVKEWNSSPRNVVEVETANDFKNSFGKCGVRLSQVLRATYYKPHSKN